MDWLFLCCFCPIIFSALVLLLKPQGDCQTRPSCRIWGGSLGQPGKTWASSSAPHHIAESTNAAAVGSTSNRRECTVLKCCQCEPQDICRTVLVWLPGYVWWLANVVKSEEEAADTGSLLTHFICLVLGLLSIKQMERIAWFHAWRKTFQRSFPKLRPGLSDLSPSRCSFKNVMEAWPPWHVIGAILIG